MAVTLLDGLPPNAVVTVDSAPIIYFLEDHPRLASRFAPVFDAAAAKGELSIFVSTITLSEVVAGPLKAGNDILAAQYHEALRGSRNWEIIPVTEEIAILAARIRTIRKLRLPDAIQVATAVVTGSVALVTHDIDFSSSRNQDHRMSAGDHSQTELLIAVIARLLEGCRHVAVGASSPIPGSAALLARTLSGDAMRVSVLGSEKHNFFTNGGVELFDLAAQGRIDAFFLGGGQIDGEANINLVGTGSYPRADVRWPGSYGSAYLYFLVPKVILFREEHTRRVFVSKVDFISAPGVSDPNVYRPGGPQALLTGLGLFSFDRARRRFRLESVHPGHTVEEILDNTGFEFDRPARVPVTPPPEPSWLALIRGSIRDEIAEVYPRFAAAQA